MSSSPALQRSLRAWLLPLLLAAAGFLGNYVNLSLFYNVDVLFGSIFVVFAIVWLRPPAALIVALAAASCSYLLWNHPWAIIIFFCEALFLLLTMRRWPGNLIQFDAIYWILIGMPLVLLFYGGVMALETQQVVLIALKQSVNGICNVALAMLVIYLVRLVPWGDNKQKKGTVASRELIFVAMVAVLMAPMVTYLFLESRAEVTRSEEVIAADMERSVHGIRNLLASWLDEYRGTVTALAAQVGDPLTADPAIVQASVAAIHRSNALLLRAGILDAQGTTLAFSPAIDERGQPTLGRDFSSRPYLEKVRRTGRAVISNLRVGTIGEPQPIIVIAAPIMVAEELRGFAIGTIDLTRFHDLIGNTLQVFDATYEARIFGASTVRVSDSRGNAIVEIPSGREAVQIADRESFIVQRVYPGGVVHMMPAAVPNVSYMGRWPHSYFAKTLTVSDDIPWTITAEVAMWPYLGTLMSESIRTLLNIWAMLFLSIIASTLLSRHFTRSLTRLSALTLDLPDTIAAGRMPTWPRSQVRELNLLSDNFQNLSEALVDSFREIRLVNEGLEQKVAGRTADLTAMTESLSTANAELQAIFDTASNGILLVSDGIIVRVNQWLEEMTGYPDGELVGRSAILLEADLAAWVEASSTFYEEIRSGNTYVAERQFRRRDGSLFWARLSARAIRPDNVTLGVVALLKDISDERAQAAALREAKDAAIAASRAKSAFLANMSHELRTPMNAIIGMSSLALRRAVEPKLADQLGKIVRASNHLLGVINDILDLSKIEAQSLSLEQTPFRLAGVIDDLLLLTEESARAKGLELRVELPAALAQLELLGDPFRLRQVLLNFIGNAIKFTVRGSVTLRVELFADSGTEVVLRFAVEDTGIGIAAAEQAKLFSAFEQTDDSIARKYGGSGLGLVISKSLVELMGGTVGVQSREGEGSTFWCTVRTSRVAVATPPATLPDTVAVEEALRALGGRVRLLLVEDEPVNREIAGDLLADVGLVADQAEDGLQAVAMARQRTYDLILMDVQMPHLSGIDATRAIRALPGYAATPILAMTASAFVEDRHACLDAGMNEHIAKPICPDELFAILHRWLCQG
ncbi:MAG: ATP-binding protein [Pelovirga sp.]